MGPAWASYVLCPAPYSDGVIFGPHPSAGTQWGVFDACGPWAHSRRHLTEWSVESSCPLPLDHLKAVPENVIVDSWSDGLPPSP